MRMCPWLSRVSTAERVGEGSSLRSSSSPVSNRAKLRLVGTPSACSISVASTSRTPPFRVSRPSPKRLHGVWPDPLGAKVHQPACAIAKLREQEAAPIAKVRIVGAELMAVITQRQRRRKVARQRLEPAEMPRPVDVLQPDLRRRPRDSGIAVCTPESSLRAQDHRNCRQAPGCADRVDRVAQASSCPDRGNGIRKGSGHVAAVRGPELQQHGRPSAPLPRLCGRRPGSAANLVPSRAYPQCPRFRAGRRSFRRRMARPRARFSWPRRKRCRSRSRALHARRPMPAT